MYSIDSRDAQLLLTYRDVFGDNIPNLIDEIRKLNMHKSISIVSELIRVRNEKCEPVKILGQELYFPFEMILKRDLCGMNPQSPEALFGNPMMKKNQHIISLQMLLILLKYIIIYGDYATLKETVYDITDDDYRKIIQLQLIVAEDISAKHDDGIDINHFIYATYHLNYVRNIANEFQRMYYMMEVLCRDRRCFDKDVQGEYRNYYDDFKSKYGITLTEYSSFLFFELQYYFTVKNYLSHKSCWRNIDEIYAQAKNKEKTAQVINMLKRRPYEYKSWAVDSKDSEWDFREFYSFPFLFDGESKYISISDVTLVNAFFEKIFWLVRECYPQKDSRAMAFWGRLFEKYIQNATEQVCNDEYKYIHEFTYGTGNSKSSDAYIRRENKLLVIEAKGFSVLVDCLAKNERIDRNNEKLFIKPVLQADERLSECYDSIAEFNGVDEAYIISVTMDNVNAVPDYYNKIHQEIRKRQKCKYVKCYFNFSIEEYEILLYLIEQNIDIMSVLNRYFTNPRLEPFSNYAHSIFDNIGMTEFMKTNYDAAAKEMKEMLW